MRRAIAASTLACVAGGVVVEAALDTHAAIETFSLMLGISVLALGVALWARRARRRIGSLRYQLALAVAIAVGAILVAVGVAAELMFISNDDALLVSVMAAVVAVVGLQVAALLTDPMVDDITRLRDRLRAVGIGDRRTDLATGGHDELAELAAEANAMIARLAEEEIGRTAAEDARQRLTIAVSHDLRTPLTSLRLLTEAIDEQVVTGATRARYLADMKTHVTALSALVDDLFDLSRLKTGEALTVEPVDLGALARETVAAMCAAAASRGIALSCSAHPADDEWLVAKVDRERLRRVLMNLIDNAIRYTPGGGDVVVSASRVDATIEVHVTDEGSGIPAEEREHVFEEFFRGGPDASRSGVGAGLGLAISRAIVDSHGGSIWLADTERGTRVCFSIPAGALPASPPGERSARALIRIQR